MKWSVSLLVIVAITVLLVLVMGSCTDQGDPVDTQEQPVTASSTTVNLAPGAATSVLISGGRAPYGITDEPDTTVVTASLADTTNDSVTLNITAAESVSVGRITSISVGDADEIMEGGILERVAHGENEVTIQIIISVSVSLANDVQPIFTTNCATPSCHTGSTAPFTLVLDSGQSYGELVNVAARAPSCNGEPRVSPGNSAGSVLYKRISGYSCAPRMPFSILLSDTLTVSEQSTIRDWIDQGALNN